MRSPEAQARTVSMLYVSNISFKRLRVDDPRPIGRQRIYAFFYEQKLADILEMGHHLG